MSNKRIQVSDLDYNQIRENLKTFLRGQTEFSDYDFDGSALSTLVDVLAYNTHYNALYTNLAINEMFLDSASKRSSVVSIANNFGYVPQSCAAAKAVFDLSVTQQNATDSVKYLQKFSTFSATVEGVSYTFYNIDDYVANRNGDNYTFNKVTVYEGTPVTNVFLCSTANQRFNLPNQNIDLATLSVTVQQTGETADFQKYERATSVLSLNEESIVYYIKELDDASYELYFGSNNLGKPIDIGNIITITYMVTNKAVANGAKLFTYGGASLGGIATAINTSTSYGGRESETIDEIKRNVAQTYFDQNRAVTVNDYNSIIKRLYSNVESVNVWGGEDNSPPVYGKVFISVKPTNASFLTPSEKTYIKSSLLKSKNVVSVIPELVDPTFLELGVDVTVYYDNSKTDRSADAIRLAVINSITSYTNNTLKKFNGIFRMSKFSRIIDDSDQSIQSNITKFKLYYEVTPKFNSSSQYKINLVNPIYRTGAASQTEQAFISTGFYIDNTSTVYYLDDDGQGNVRLFSIIAETGVASYKNTSIGTVDYENGIIDIKGLTITNLADANFYFIFKTDSFDVVSIRNQIVDIPLNRLNVTVIQDQSSNAGLISGYNYKFTSSRE
jgi:hypothetical protein